MADIHVRNITEEVYQRMRVLAIKTKKTMGQLANQAFAEFLERAESGK